MMPLLIMKALLLTEYWPPQIGGIQNYLTQMAGHLSPGSIDVVAPLPGKNRTEVVYGAGIGKVYRARWLWPVIKPAWYPLWRQLLSITRDTHYDLTLCGKGLVDGLLGYYLKQKRGIPYVVFTYAMEINTWCATRRNKKKLIKVLTNADRVVYINDITKGQLLALGVQEKQLVKIWPGIDDRYFNPTPAVDIEEVYGLSEPYILCVARLVARKGIDTLIEAFSEIEQTRFGNVHLAIVGEGPEREELERLADQVFVKNSVHFLGAVPDMHLPTLYSNARVFALTPRSVDGDIEGFGMVYIEAAASGVPAIGTQTGGVPEAVVHNQTGLLVQPDSPAEVANALSLLLANPSLRQTLGTQGQRRAFNQFRWPKRALLVKGMIDAIVAEQVSKKTSLL